MFENAEKLAAHLGTFLGRKARIVVWAYNSHLDNAAATDMGRRGEINIGQLVSEKYGDGRLRLDLRPVAAGNSSFRLGRTSISRDWV